MHSLVLLLTALLGGGGSADPGSVPQDPQRPRFRSGVELVEVDVTVSRKGKFLAGLRPEDFLLLENGEPRTIQLITLVAGADVQVPESRAASGSPADTVPLPPPGQIFVLFFDLEHLSRESFNRVKRAADQFVAGLAPRDIVSIVADQPGFPNVLTLNKVIARRLLNDLRPRGSTLRSQLLEWPRLTDFEATGIFMGDQAAFQDVQGRACEERPEMCPEPAHTLIRAKVSEFVGESRATTARTLGTLRSFASSAARLSGRKNVVLLSDGFYVGDSATLVQQTVDVLARARMVVYGLDALGLQRSFGNWADASADGGSTLSAAMDDGDSGMQMAAWRTGGFVVRNRNDLHQALNTIRADAASYYILAYEPGPQGEPQRKIEVKVTRDGVDVRHRRWVFIPGSGTKPSDLPRRPH